MSRSWFFLDYGVVVLSYFLSTPVTDSNVSIPWTRRPNITRVLGAVTDAEFLPTVSVLLFKVVLCDIWMIQPGKSCSTMVGIDSLLCEYKATNDGT